MFKKCTITPSLDDGPQSGEVISYVPMLAGEKYKNKKASTYN